MSTAPKAREKATTDECRRPDECRRVLDRACRSLAGGDSSLMRVVPYHLPLVADRGAGCFVWDVAGKQYIDLNMAYGPLLFGHCPAKVIQAVTRQITERGSQLGFPTEVSMRVAEKIKVFFPGMELMRFANSGTEAVASSIRLARGVTGKNKIIAFEGHYHGWSDGIFHRYHAALDDLPPSGYGPAIPGTLGMAGGPHDVITVGWNDLDLLERCLNEYRGEVAAVIMEPIMGNAGCIPPQEQYLQGVREMTLTHDVMLIFDEVITGMRVAPGGAQEYYRVSPDITIISKALGGGYPVAAFGASREIMQAMVEGKIFHGGVYSGNAVVMSAAEAVLDEVIAHGETIYGHLDKMGRELAGGLGDIMSRLGVPHVVHQVGAIVSLFLTTSEVADLENYRDVRRHCDFEKYIRFQHQMQQSGVYFHPNQFETMFLSTAHSPDQIATVLERAEDAARCTLVN